VWRPSADRPDKFPAARTNTLLIALLNEWPVLRWSICLGPADAARKALAGAGLADQAAVVAGSFFDPLYREPGATFSRRSFTTGTMRRRGG
jgi:hypothetical protein